MSEKVYTQAELDAAVQATTERMSCGHVKADQQSAYICGCPLTGHREDQQAHCDTIESHCRTCAEIQDAEDVVIKELQAAGRNAIASATAVAMAQQREADIDICIRWAKSVYNAFPDQAIAVQHRATEIRNAPLASAPAQEWMERQLAAARLAEARWWNENVPLAAHVGCHDIIDDCVYCARIAKLEAELHQP